MADVSPEIPVASDRALAEHYRWGDGCDGWRLLARPDLSVIEECVPPGMGEVRHRHRRARQFFYVLSGHARIETEAGSIELGAGQGAHVPPGCPHRFHNPGSEPVRFLVVSAPSTAGDRENLT